MLRQDGQAEEWSLLENFWRKHNKVLLDNAAINQEKFHLQNENAKLRSLLKQYLDGITVNEDVMNMRNNLLMTTYVLGDGCCAHCACSQGLIMELVCVVLSTLSWVPAWAPPTRRGSFWERGLPPPLHALSAPTSLWLVPTPLVCQLHSVEGEYCHRRAQARSSSNCPSCVFGTGKSAPETVP